MRVVHVVASLEPGRGGPPRSVAGLAAAQARAGVEVAVVAGGGANSGGLTIPGVLTQQSPHLSKRFEIPGVQLVGKLRSSINQADIVHVHGIWNGTASSGLWLATRARKPTVLSPHGMLDQRNVAHRRLFKRCWMAAIDRRSIRSLRGWHFLDESERDGCSWISSVERSLAIVQPNGLDIQALTTLLEAAPPLSTGQVGEPKVRLVFLGRLHPIKGLELQVELLARLVAEGVDAALHLIGPDDGAAESVRETAQALRVTARVMLHGAIYGPERLAWLRDASVVLLTSHSEANSISAAEAMAVGSVLVATATCNLEAARRAGAAVVVPRDAASLVRAVRGVLDPGRAASLRDSAQRFASSLDWGPLATDMLAFYEQVREGPE